ncbi:MAG: UDP-glucose 4-epimerase GalE [Ruminococcus sp.]|nr:UDP-glucose 4-epimerase GalE [Oscillospiraceae bacterium]MCI6387914.1 UDP-glucose 4-epimerase GalE [Ruminococcus sp.]MDY4909848.1 UDP-glucose 4-epimerase GalE [Candidatus Fimenecus sp.]MDD6270934.1 UDP-glucose 4-epimerase GalE [Ruminococcus sp.]MDD7344820.1 UDP-glucose 4-epimerase GalE [Ruminococcus sp.]
MAILVTGGAGFIGSHTCVELLNAGYEIVVVDNYYNANPKSLERVKELTGKDFKSYECDIRDSEGMDKIFKENKIDAVIHFAGLKAVGESCQKPIEYYDNNIGGTLKLCDVMRNNGCKNIVFSSSATVYGMKNVSPLKETMKTGGTTNPYGTTKYMIEIILEDIYKSDNEWNVTLLRYFNPIGAHESGRIGENPSGIPNNLMPYITQVAIGKRPFLSVYGNDYDTPDGTCIRDYIHVVDLADGHVKAVNNILDGKKGVQIFNLGTGKGYSVLDIVKAFSKAYGKELPYKIAPRRPGDLAVCFSDPTKAKEVLGWEAKRGIDDMCRDSWNWQSKNPNGYDD